MLSEVAEIHGGGRLGFSGNDFINDGFAAYGAAGLNGQVAQAEYSDQTAVILSSIGARCGKCFLVSGAWTSLANTQVIIPKEHVVDAKFLWYQLNDERRWHRSGSAQPFIKPSDVKSHAVWVPSLEEQRRIAAILDQADALRTKRRQVLAHLESLEGALYVDAFSGGDWPSFRLGEVASTTSGGTPDRARPENYGGGIPWVKSGELHSGVVVETSESISEVGLASSSANLMPAGTVLIAMYGATAGVVSRLGIEAATNQAVCSITPTAKLDPSYLIAALKSMSSQLRDLRSGGAQPNLSQAVIRALEIKVPSVLAQRKFASTISRVASERQRVERGMATEDELFTSLQSRAFRGEL